MYGLPLDLDLSLFVGKTLQLVSFAYAQVDLSFDSELLLSVQGGYLHDWGQAGATAARPNAPHSTLMQLLEQSVVMASKEDRGTLVLRFGNGHVFKCFDDSIQYECFIITCPGQPRVIV